MHWKYLLFDLDGTLTDPMQGITRSVQYALRHFGIEVEDLTTLSIGRSFMRGDRISRFPC